MDMLGHLTAASASPVTSAAAAGHHGHHGITDLSSLEGLVNNSGLHDPLGGRDYHHHAAAAAAVAHHHPYHHQGRAIDGLADQSWVLLDFTCCQFELSSP